MIYIKGLFALSLLMFAGAALSVSNAEAQKPQKEQMKKKHHEEEGKMGKMPHSKDMQEKK